VLRHFGECLLEVYEFILNLQTQMGPGTRAKELKEWFAGLRLHSQLMEDLQVPPYEGLFEGDFDVWAIIAYQSSRIL